MPEIEAGMVTSGIELPGYRIVRNFGIVRGIVVRSRSIIGTLGVVHGSAARRYRSPCLRHGRAGGTPLLKRPGCSRAFKEGQER